MGERVWCLVHRTEIASNTKKKYFPIIYETGVNMYSVNGALELNIKKKKTS